MSPEDLLPKRKIKTSLASMRAHGMRRSHNDFRKFTSMARMCIEAEGRISRERNNATQKYDSHDDLPQPPSTEQLLRQLARHQNGLNLFPNAFKLKKRFDERPPYQEWMMFRSNMVDAKTPAQKEDLHFKPKKRLPIDSLQVCQLSLEEKFSLNKGLEPSRLKSQYLSPKSGKDGHGIYLTDATNPEPKLAPNELKLPKDVI